MYKWEKYNEYDSKNPTFSSSLLEKINKSLKNNRKNDLEEDLSFFRATRDAKKADDDKISRLRRASLVEKWMEKKDIGEKVSKKSKVKSYNTLLEEFDVQDTLFLGTTSTSSSSSEAEYSGEYRHPMQHKPRVPCFIPPMPMSVRTRPIESKFLEKYEEKTNNVKDEELLKSRSKALKIYSNLKNLKQPVSPGLRLTGFINSLFAKDDKNKNKSKNTNTNTNKNSNKSKNKNKNKNENNGNDKRNNNIVAKPEKIKTTSYSACTTPTSYSRSCLSNNTNKRKKFQDDGIKRTVSFCPVSVILDEDSRPCGHKSVNEEGCNRLSPSKFAKSLTKKYDELRVLNELKREIDNNKKLEEVALDFLSDYCWDSKSYDQCGKDKVNHGDYGGNCGGNYGQRGDNYDYDDENDDDGLSCSSSDLFELEHLSLIGNELPVYETTQFDPMPH